jgi:hypothetical protein
MWKQSLATAEQRTRASTIRSSNVGRYHAASAGVALIPPWAPNLPQMSFVLGSGHLATESGPTGSDAAEMFMHQREMGLDALATLQQHIAQETAASSSSSSSSSSQARQAAKKESDVPRTAPVDSKQALEGVLRWASLSARVGSDSAWGKQPGSVAPPHAKRMKPLTVEPQLSTVGLAAGGGAVRVFEPSDPLGRAAVTGTIAGADDSSASVPFVADHMIRMMPPDPEALGVPRSETIRSAGGLPGTGSSDHLKRMAGLASREQVLSGTYPADTSATGQEDL